MFLELKQCQNSNVSHRPACPNSVLTLRSHKNWGEVHWISRPIGREGLPGEVCLVLTSLHSQGG